VHGFTGHELAAQSVTDKLLRVEDLRVAFPVGRGRGRHETLAEVVRGIDFEVKPHETVGIVGESGCGKTTTALAILGLVPAPGRVLGGRIWFDDEDLLTLGPRALRRVRGDRIGLVFQDPTSALDPLLPVGHQIQDAIRAHLPLSRRAARARAHDLLRMVEIGDPAARFRAHPHELSGGMRQRVCIAMALACDPSLLIADEPTTALDVTIQAQILELLREQQKTRGMALIFVTHAIDLLAKIADRVLVMYAGEIVEHAPTDELLSSPQHPYTQALLKSMPILAGTRRQRLRPIPGSPPNLSQRPAGCAFSPRCPLAIPQCHQHSPERVQIAPNHDVACWVREAEFNKSRVGAVG
jgi:oligopeptide/dipeptide ABC transporter ATP-binding protein